MNKKEIINEILNINNYQDLNPPQKEACKFLTLSENLLICSPTASGKTTIFELYLLDYILNKKKKVIYISPLKALTNEHFRETKRKFAKKYNLRIGISTGDMDSSSKNLKNYDVLFLTFEKFDSVVRHNPYWLKEIGLITIDEIHEIGSDRGATLEILITQIRSSFTNIYFLCLSATIGNAKELNEWLDGQLILSNYRPVPLEIGILNQNTVYFDKNNTKQLKDNKFTNKIKDNGVGNLIYDTLKKNKQIIVFCNSRKNTMSFANKYSIISQEFIKDPENQLKIAKEIGNVLDNPTKQCLLLYNDIKKGCCFHHAGLVSKQRHLIEEQFKNGNIKVIFATPTLAAGINLPAYRVIINSIYRFTNGGMHPIPINEFHQMAGRAGRPKYDNKGQAIVNINKEKDINLIYNSYIIATPTNVESQLSKIQLLRSNLLSIILINKLTNIKQVLDYISKTFYYFTFGNNIEIKENIKEIINEFIDFKFLEDNTINFKISELGTKVCLLYLDPISARNILEDLKIKNKKEVNEIESIFTIVNTSELYPYIKYKKNDEDEIFEIFNNIKDKIYFDYEDLNLLNKIQLSRLIKDWINEKKEDRIIEKYKSSPGQIQELINKCSWLIHCILELTKFVNIDQKKFDFYKKLELRLKYGIKNELLELVQIKNIGRIRARKLFDNGITNINDIKNKTSKFIDILGNKRAITVFKDLKINYKSESHQNNPKKEKENSIFKKQKTIFDF